MFGNDGKIDKVLNPLKITNKSKIEFTVGELKDAGMWKFRKVIEFTAAGRFYSRYLIESDLYEDDMILEAFPAKTQLEVYLYRLNDTVVFSEEFLFDVAGQRYLTTPDGVEYIRCIMPNDENRIDGIKGRIQVLDVDTNEIERTGEVTLWDYERQEVGLTKFLNLEMTEEDGMFRIFTGEMIEGIFYKVYLDE